MTCELSPGDDVHLGNAVTLTVLAIEGDRIRFKLEWPKGKCPRVATAGEDANHKQKQPWGFPLTVAIGMVSSESV
jgi:hypothetical protein